VLEGALERSLELAASMDSRGYGRRGDVPARRRRAGQAATLCGALAVMVGVFGVLESGAPGVLGIPMIALGGALLAASLRAANASATRSQYRPDPWRAPEWMTVASGAGALVALVVAGRLGIDGLHPLYSPLRAPTLPVLPAVGVLCASLPALVTPALPADAT
jgi:energy-coupling factor transport system permease protein